MKNLLMECNLRTVLIFIFIGLIVPSTSAFNIFFEESSRPVYFDGEWNKRERSLFPKTIPFSAFINSNMLYIQNTRPNCDITIQIVDTLTSQVVVEETVTKDESSYVVILIDTLPSGNYTLEIRNAFGGYIYGSFVKDTDDY